MIPAPREDENNKARKFRSVKTERDLTGPSCPYLSAELHFRIQLDPAYYLKTRKQNLVLLRACFTHGTGGNLCQVAICHDSTETDFESKMHNWYM